MLLARLQAFCRPLVLFLLVLGLGLGGATGQVSASPRAVLGELFAGDG
jgi:hypothetical protein